jgi:trehalose-6-phosphate synthase
MPCCLPCVLGAHDGVGFSNGVLWPLFHYIDTIKFNSSLYEAYVRANELFAQAVTSIWQEGDMIWIHECVLLPPLAST